MARVSKLDYIFNISYVTVYGLGYLKIDVELELSCNRNAFLCYSGVNFINIKRTNFSYARWFRQLFSSYMYVAETTFVRKIRTFNVDEIDGRS